MTDYHRLTLEGKVGQLFFLGFQGYSPDRDSQSILDLVRPGGLLLAQRNIESFDQIYALTARLRGNSGLAPFIAIEQEGGAVDRLKQVFSPLPSARELSLGGVLQIRAAARAVAAELESTGFNLNFAPVLDLAVPGSVIRERTFSAVPIEVARLAGIFAEELTHRNILVCAKHFPGLGSARRDPHFGLPRIDRSRKELLQEDILPFLDLIDDVGMIMVGHAHYPAFGDERAIPASLSHRIVEGLLRKKLGFEGVVITADMAMGAIAGLGLTPDTFLAAFEAGNDMLLFSQATPLVETAFRSLVRAARSSPALRARIDQSADRILRLKNRIPFVPLRYRAPLKPRITRQIEKLRKSVETAAGSKFVPELQEAARQAATDVAREVE